MSKSMTEKEWLPCTEPKSMLRYLCDQPGFIRRKAPRRKLRLFGCACCRQIWDEMVDARSRAAVEIAERLADGEASPKEVEHARDEASRASRKLTDLIFGSPEERAAEWAREKEDKSLRRAAQACTLILYPQAGNFAWATLGYSLDPSSPGYKPFRAKQHWQAAVVRDLFGNPFRPAPKPKRQWLTWGDGTVPAVARGIYAERAFDRLPILADALLDAGCNDDDLLSHLRGPGPHVRGCWALDVLLGKS